MTAGVKSPYPLYAFYALESKLKHHKRKISLNEFKSKLDLPQKEEELSPLFITWDVLDRQGKKQLRGCIGTFSPLAVEKGIAEYSLIAALEDYRFTPITLGELPELSVSVTLLQNFEKVDDPLDWEIGKHGIKIKFSKNGKEYSGTFLPQVAPEQGWNKEETLRHLILKAGFSHGELNIDDISLTRYQGLKSSATYEEYREFIENSFKK